MQFCSNNISSPCFRRQPTPLASWHYLLACPAQQCPPFLNVIEGHYRLTKGLRVGNDVGDIVACLKKTLALHIRIIIGILLSHGPWSTMPSLRLWNKIICKKLSEWTVHELLELFDCTTLVLTAIFFLNYFSFRSNQTIYLRNKLIQAMVLSLPCLDHLFPYFETMRRHPSA